MVKDNPASSLWKRLQAGAYSALHIIDLRLALVIGLIAFLVAVSFDSAGNPAEAADLIKASGSWGNVPIRVVAVSSSGGATEASFTSVNPLPSAESEGSIATSQRLHHGMLTSALVTSNRLTEAHFFTDLPSGEDFKVSQLD